MAPPSRRAAEVLDRLAGSAGRVRIDLPTAGELTGRSRGPGAADQLGSDADQVGSDRPNPVRRRRPTDPASDRPAPTGRPSLRAVAVGVAAAILLGAVVVARRPPPLEDRLPMAGAAGSAAAPDATKATNPAAPAVPAAASEALEARRVVVVHVAGAVRAPGVVELHADARVVDAVEAAGGLLAEADLDRVNLAAPLSDGLRVVVPRRGQEVPPEVPLAAPSTPSAAGPGGAGVGVDLVDVNTASAAELETLPGVGPATAAAIIAHRERSGPFRSVEALTDVRGIGEAKLDALRDLVRVGGP